MWKSWKSHAGRIHRNDIDYSTSRGNRVVMMYSLRSQAALDMQVLTQLKDQNRILIHRFIAVAIPFLKK